MLKVHAPLLANMVAHITSVQDQIELGEPLRVQPGGLPNELLMAEASRILIAIRVLKWHLGELGMSPVLSQKLERLNKAFKREGDYDYDPKEVRILLRELKEDFLAELDTAEFLMIPSERRELYKQEAPPFGQEVYDKFSGAVSDIKAAGRCLALDEWTAAVFHLMGVLEIGLRSLTRGLGIRMTKSGKDIDHAQWGELLRAIQDEIKKLENPPKKLTAARRRRLGWYSEMAAHFSNCNAAWRIHVSHVRGKYDQREADEVWTHVKAFMQLLAAGPP